MPSIQPCEEAFTQQYLRTFHRLYGYEAQIYQPEVYTQIQSLNPQDWLQEALDQPSTRPTASPPPRS
jgi:asparagine synthase (glutamine-hydrolysing)